MKATLAKELPAGEDAYAYEFKWDGVRALVYVNDGETCIQSRNLLDVTAQYPEVASVGSTLEGRTAVLDGEIVALDAKGRPSFQRLQSRMHVAAAAEVKRRMQEVPVAYLAFDVVYLDGRSTMALPYTERRSLLEALPIAGPYCQIPPSTIGSFAAVYEAGRRQGLEGVVAKRPDSTYEPGRRSRAWLKLKYHRRQEFVIGGWTWGEGRRQGHLGALLLGYYDGDELRYAGNVGTGFTEAMLRELGDLLEPLRREASPFADLARLKNSVFVEPTLVGEVEFNEWTRDGTLRHPAFKGLREDKDPRQVVREEPPS